MQKRGNRVVLYRSFEGAFGIMPYNKRHIRNILIYKWFYVYTLFILNYLFDMLKNMLFLVSMCRNGLTLQLHFLIVTYRDIYMSQIQLGII